MSNGSYGLQKFIFGISSGVFGWVWLLSIPAAIGYSIFSLFFENKWMIVLQIILSGLIAKFFLRGLRDNLERVNLEYYLTREKKFSSSDAYKLWVLVYGSGGAEGHTRVLSIYQITDEQLEVMRTMLS